MRLLELIEPTSLATFFAEVRSRSPAAGVDGVTPELFAKNLEERLRSLGESLRAESWEPSALKRIRKDKPGGGVRLLSIPTVEDRIVIEVLKAILEREVEPLLSRAAFAYRPRRSARDAVEAVAERIAGGAAWIAQADIQEFFDSVRLAPVVGAVRDLVSDAAAVRLLDRVLARHARSPGRGLAQGSALSPLLSNLALLPLDRRLCAAGFDLVRYSDNICITARTRPEAEEALRVVESEARRLGLQLKKKASAVSDVKGGVLWLGFWLGEGGRRAGDGAIRALRDRVERAARGLAGDALRAHVAPIVRGWAQYFDAPLPEGVTFGAHDALVRGLLAEHVSTPESAARAEPPAAAEPGDAGKEPVSDTVEGAPDAWEDEDWTDAGGVDQGDDLLAEVERLAAIGDFAGAENAYEEARRRSEQAEAPEAEPGAAVEMEIDDDAIDAFLRIFTAGQDCFETARGMVGGKRDFTLVERPPTPADVRAHLAGRAALAIRPRLPGGTCTLAVLDIDALEAGLAAARAYAGALVAVAESWGWAALVEETGGRGIHVWIPIAGRLRADEAARALDALRSEAGSPKEGVQVEALPGRDDAPDLFSQAMTLPLGIHLETGRRSRLRWAHGVEIEPDLRGLFAERWTEPGALLARLPESTPAGAAERQAANGMAASSGAPAARAAPGLPVWTGFGAAVGRLMEGCAVLRHLAEKAASTGHLGHPERLSILYTLGHLGENGAQAIHAIIGRCANYDAAETTRQIGRLTGLPIGCARMREKHATPELMPLCCCDFGDVAARGGYPTPLLHASGFRHSWRAVLRGREAARARPVDARGVRAVPEPAELRAAPADVAAGPSDDTGVLPRGAPPHEWA